MKWINRLGWLAISRFGAGLVMFHLFPSFRTSDDKTRSYFEALQEARQVRRLLYQPLLSKAGHFKP